MTPSPVPSPSESAPPVPARRPWRRRLWMLAVALPILLALLPTLVLQLPPVQARMRQMVANRTGLPMQWKWVWWHPGRGLVIEGLRLDGAESNGVASGFSARRLVLRPDYRALWKKRLVMRSIDLTDPKLTVVRGVDGRWLLPGKSPEPPAGAPVPPGGPDAAAAPPPAALTPQGNPVPPAEPAIAMAPATPANADQTGQSAPPGQPAASDPPVGPPPDVRLRVSGGEFSIIDARDGQCRARLQGGEMSVGPEGGRARAEAGVFLHGEWKHHPLDFPLSWHGPTLQVSVAERVEQESQLRVVVQVAAVPGLPVMVQAVARDCPVAWCGGAAALMDGYFPVSGRVAGDFRMLWLPGRPGARAAMVKAEARDLVVPTSGWPGADTIRGWMGRPGESRPDGMMGIGVVLVEAGLQGSLMEIPRMQIDAAGAIAALRLRAGPGGVMAGEAMVLLDGNAAEKIRQLEARLPPDRHLGFTNTSEITLADGGKISRKSRVIRLAGSLMRPTLELWPDLGFLGIGESLSLLQATRLPDDPNRVELIPIGQ